MLLVSLVCPELRKYKCPTTEFAVEGLVRVRRSVPSPAAIRMTSTRTSNARNFPLCRGCLGSVWKRKEMMLVLPWQQVAQGKYEVTGRKGALEGKAVDQQAVRDCQEK